MASSIDSSACIADSRVVYTALAVVLASVLLAKIHSKIKPLPFPPHVPGPERHPFIGFLKFIDDNWENWPHVLYKQGEKYKTTWGGPVPKFGALPGAYFYLVDETSVKYMLNDAFEHYVKGKKWHSIFRELLGDGIFNTDGCLWKKHRKVTANMFSRNLMRHTAAVTLSKLAELSDMVDRKIQEAKGSSVEIDVQDAFHRLTFDTTSLVSFGVDFDSMRRERPHPFNAAFDEMQSHILERVKDPLFELKRAFFLGGRERRIRHLKKILDSHAHSIIGTTRRTAAQGHVLGPDILSRFIDHASKTGDQIEDEELRDVILNILLAGRDTTACALSWTLYQLTKNPEIAERIREEVNSTCGFGEDADYSYDTLSVLQYTHAVILEVLRLHPSVPNDAKYAVCANTLPDGTLIPAGAGVGYQPYAMGRSENVWGQDALEFKPERFIGSKEPSAYKYPVFNAGPRTCLGKPLALTTMKLALAYLLPRFNFIDKRGHGGDYKWKLALQMKGGFFVDVSRRTETKD